MLKKKETEKKIDELLSKMTLQEKIGQLQQIGPSPVGGFEISDEEAEKMYTDGRISEKLYLSIVNHTMLDGREEEIRKGNVGSFIGIIGAEKSNHLQRIAVEESRLGIPMIMGLDVIHGHKTVFPAPLAEACSFNDEAFRLSAEVAAREAAEDGVHWTYAPVVDVTSDSRWGRIMEGAGEDTYLASRFAAAKVKGFQGDDISDPEHIAACVKHFAAYGAVEGGRDYDTVDMSLPKFYEKYLPPYASAIKAGVATVMAAFNDLNGIPCTANRWLLKDVLRNELGFEGFVISDAHAIEEIVNHGTAKDRKDAAVQAIKAGIDMDLGSDCYIEFLEELVREGKVNTEDIDESVRNILRIKYALGLFDNPYVDENRESTKLCKKHRDISYDIAKQCAVLLKNDNDILPLDKNRKIAVVGEMAAMGDKMNGSWVMAPEPGTAVSLLDGLKNKGFDIVYSPCYGETMPLDRKKLSETVKDADVVIAAISYWVAGEAYSLCRLELPGDQVEMLKILKETGKPTVSVLFNGRTLALSDVVPNTDALIEGWHLGTEAGNALADIISGDYNPSGRLSASVPYYSGQFPIYYNHVNTGRPASESHWTSKYHDAPVEPLYPFGYGLSYTEFEYSGLKLSVSGDILTAAVTVKNTGKRDGMETVQLYTHRRDAKRVRPVRELKGYRRVELSAGQEKEVTICVTREELGYYDTDLNFITDQSDFDIWMAHDSSCGEHGVIYF